MRRDFAVGGSSGCQFKVADRVRVEGGYHSNNVTGSLGVRMTEPESMTQMRETQEATRGKGGKGKAIIKRSKTEAPSRRQEEPVESRHSGAQQPDAGASGETETRDPQVIARIEQRAYRLFEAGGFEHGHDLEHWLEAERQITGSSDRSDR